MIQERYKSFLITPSEPDTTLCELGDAQNNWAVTETSSTSICGFAYGLLNKRSFSYVGGESVFDRFEQSHVYKEKLELWDAYQSDTLVIMSCEGGLRKQSVRTNASPSWLNEAKNLDQQGRYDQALRIIYREMNAWLRAGQLKKCNDLLNDTSVHDLSADIILAVLSVTLRFQDRLACRAGFFSRAKRHLLSDGFKSSVLDGLG